MLSDSWLGEVATVEDGATISLHADRLIRHLLLFDQVSLYSPRFREFDPLIQTFGFNGVLALLRSGAIRIHCSRLTIGQIGQTLLDSRNGRLLPLHSYAFASVAGGRTEKEHIAGCFDQHIRTIDVLSFKEKKSLIQDIAEHLLYSNPDVLTTATSQLITDLAANVPQIETALQRELRRTLGGDVNCDGIAIRLHRLDADDFRAETNISERLGISGQDSHSIVERALLAVGGLNQRLAEMQHYSSLVNFWYRDLPILDSKLAYLQTTAAPEHLDQRAREILSLNALPDLTLSLQQGEFDIERFLEIRNSDEGRAFRAFLHTATKADLDELKDRAESMTAKLGVKFQSAGARGVRLIVSTGLGLIPGAGLVLGPVAGALDTFVVDRMFGHVPTALSFLLHSYSSVFKPHD